jgi:hypothetical protein
MKARFAPLALIITLLITLVAVGVVVVELTGGGTLTIEEYFQRLQALNDAADERSEELENAFNADFLAAGSEEGVLQAFENFFTDSLPIFEDFVDGMEDLDPPAAVEDAHNESVEGSAELLAVVRSVLDRLDDVDSTASLEDLFEEEGFYAARERLDTACVALQDIADENEIDVDLDCEG